MPKRFALQKLDSTRFEAVSFSLDSTRPEEYYPSLERQLGKLGVNGEVLLDLLACNGTTSRRFFAVKFDGTHLDFKTLRREPQDALDGAVVAYCRKYYAKWMPKLDGTVLSSAARRAFTAV